MTSLLHWVADDWQTSQAFKSRVGTYSSPAFAATKSATGFWADPDRNGQRSQIAFAGTFPACPNVLNQPANALFPLGGHVRAYEMLFRLANVADKFTISTADGGVVLQIGNGFVSVKLGDTPTGFSASVIQAWPTDTNYHYFTIIIDATVPTAAVLTVYDGDVFILSTVLSWGSPFNMNNWQTPTLATATSFFFGTSGDSLVELLIHDQPLTQLQVSTRVFRFRSFS